MGQCIVIVPFKRKYIISVIIVRKTHFLKSISSVYVVIPYHYIISPSLAQGKLRLPLIYGEVQIPIN